MHNIFIEGIQGMGKSTLLQKIAEKRPDLHVCREGDYSPVELAWCAWMTEGEYGAAMERYPALQKELADRLADDHKRDWTALKRVFREVLDFREE